MGERVLSPPPLRLPMLRLLLMPSCDGLSTRVGIVTSALPAGCGGENIAPSMPCSSSHGSVCACPLPSVESLPWPADDRACTPRGGDIGSVASSQSGAGNATLKATPVPRIAETIPSEAPTGTFTTSASASTILTPMKKSVMATAGCRKRAEATAWCTNAYSARSDRIANMLLVYTTNASCVMPNTAGMLSTANTTSEISITATTSTSGVNRRRPVGERCAEMKLSPS
mmetsp:Transcript_12572/g.52897  ORF Transcript_12572/g.52897 Transcript_12572/m.52897 type:complete len:228 (-) Transcript_12572:1537-2220(-)